jgi:hypothetical protein
MSPKGMLPDSEEAEVFSLEFEIGGVTEVGVCQSSEGVDSTKVFTMFSTVSELGLFVNMRSLTYPKGFDKSVQ